MISLDVLETLVAASLVLLLGRKLVASSSLLKAYSIPAVSYTHLTLPTTPYV